MNIGPTSLVKAKTGHMKKVKAASNTMHIVGTDKIIDRRGL